MSILDGVTKQMQAMVDDEVDRRLKTMIPIAWKEVVENAVQQIEKLRAVVDQKEGQIAQLLEEQKAHAEEKRVAEWLLQMREKVLKEIPPCPAHGQMCLEYCREWIQGKREDHAKKKKRPK